MFVSAGSMCEHGRGEGAVCIRQARSVPAMWFYATSGSQSATTSTDQLQISNDGCCHTA